MMPQVLFEAIVKLDSVCKRGAKRGGAGRRTARVFRSNSHQVEGNKIERRGFAMSKIIIKRIGPLVISQEHLNASFRV